MQEEEKEKNDQEGRRGRKEERKRSLQHGRGGNTLQFRTKGGLKTVEWDSEEPAPTRLLGGGEPTKLAFGGKVFCRREMEADSEDDHREESQRERG